MFEDLDEITDLESPEVIESVWKKAIIVDGYNEELYRHDFAGAWIYRDAYGKTDSDGGWEIDHVYPVAKGGKNHFLNLRPMNWKNNRSKGDDYPRYTAVVVAKDTKNIEKDTHCLVKMTLQEKLEELYKL